MTTPSHPSSAIKAILLIGLFAGTLDILAAFIQTYISSNVMPMAVLRYIASGAVGMEAFKGGVPMALLGLLIHYCIATAWALLFFLLYPKLSILSKNKYVVGLAYGIFIWAIMNLVVVPLTNVPKGGGIKFPGAFIGMGILMVAMGLPIAMMVNKYYSSKYQG